MGSQHGSIRVNIYQSQRPVIFLDRHKQMSADIFRSTAICLLGCTSKQHASPRRVETFASLSDSKGNPHTNMRLHSKPSKDLQLKCNCTRALIQEFSQYCAQNNKINFFFWLAGDFLQAGHGEPAKISTVTANELVQLE